MNEPKPTLAELATKAGITPEHFQEEVVRCFGDHLKTLMKKQGADKIAMILEADKKRVLVNARIKKTSEENKQWKWVTYKP